MTTPAVIRYALLALMCFTQNVMAQEKTHHFYYCKGGKVVRTGIKFTLSEMAVWFKNAKVLPPRPDYGHFVFVDANLWKDNTPANASWERTSTMAKRCREERACGGHNSSGRQVATLAGPATVGGSKDAANCEQQYTISVSKCGADGALQTQKISGTAQQLKRFTGGDPTFAAGRVLYQPPASGAAPEWRENTSEELNRECRASAGNTRDILLWDGTWTIRVVNEHMSDCPAQALAMNKAAAALANTTRKVKWGNPPHPTDLLPQTRELTTWRGSGTAWTLQYEPASVAGQDSPIKVNVDYAFNGRALDRIDISSRLQIRMAPALAKIAGFGGHCIYEMDAVAERVNP